jgi:hypothetical protein
VQSASQVAIIPFRGSGMMEKEAHRQDATGDVRPREVDPTFSAVTFLNSRPVHPLPPAPLPWYENRVSAWLLLLPVAVGLGAAIAMNVPATARRAPRPGGTARSVERGRPWVIVPEREGPVRRRQRVTTQNSLPLRHRPAEPFTDGPPRREAPAPLASVRSAAPAQKRSELAVRPVVHSLPGPAHRTGPRVMIDPAPVRENVVPVSPEESFRAAVEHERMERQRSAEAFRLAEEKERRERERSEEAFRQAEQLERESRHGR